MPGSRQLPLQLRRTAPQVLGKLPVHTHISFSQLNCSCRQEHCCSLSRKNTLPMLSLRGVTGCASVHAPTLRQPKDSRVQLHMKG